MDGIFTEIRRRFSYGSIVVRYIYINVAIFVALRLAMVALQLFDKPAQFLDYVELPASLTLLAQRPWTLLTYMFVHIDFLHILFNMLWLWWFGNIFLSYLSGRQFGGLYILGGLMGAVFFVTAYNIFPLFSINSVLMGASASVMAVVFAIAFYRKDLEINLLLIGRIRLVWLALGALLIDILAITSENAGGHIAHIGGAMIGVIFASLYARGKDITVFPNRIIDLIVNLFRRKKPVFRVHRQKTASTSGTAGKRPETDYEYRQRKNEENAVIDRILDKLKHSGYESLSAEEKRKLFEASRK